MNEYKTELEQLEEATMDVLCRGIIKEELSPESISSIMDVGDFVIGLFRKNGFDVSIRTRPDVGKDHCKLFLSISNPQYTNNMVSNHPMVKSYYGKSGEDVSLNDVEMYMFKDENGLWSITFWLKGHKNGEQDYAASRTFGTLESGSYDGNIEGKDVSVTLIKLVDRICRYIKSAGRRYQEDRYGSDDIA